MKEGTIKELISGEYYFIEWKTGSKYLFKYIDSGKSNYIHETTYGNYATFNTPSMWQIIRKITFEERMHLEACIKANKFIPLEQVEMSINYEIY